MISWELLQAVPILDNGAHLSDVEAQRIHGWLCFVLCADRDTASDTALGAALCGEAHLLHSGRALSYAEISRIVEVLRGRTPRFETARGPVQGADTLAAQRKIEELRTALDAIQGQAQ